jgi:hypothetical protein
MFLENKYSKWYWSIMERAWERQWTGSAPEHSERHHVFPKSLGGSNGRDNLIKLTAREHFLVHWLLIKMTYGDAQRKMRYALVRMTNGNRIRAAWEYALGREHNRIASTGNSYKKGIPNSLEARKKISVKLKGQRFTEEHRRKIRLANLGRMPTKLGVKMSVETKRKIAAKARGKKSSLETRQKISQSKTGKCHSLQSRLNMAEGHLLRKMRKLGLIPDGIPINSRERRAEMQGLLKREK